MNRDYNTTFNFVITLQKFGIGMKVSRHDCEVLAIRWPLMKRIARLERLLGDESEE